MKKIFFLTLVLFSVFNNAQVGIKTAAPVGALDVNGDLNVRREIRTGGTNTVKGTVGVLNTIYHNNTDLAVNDWKNIRIADGQNSMSLSFVNTVFDQTGAVFSGANGSTSPYTENSAITSDWVVLSGAVDTFSVSYLRKIELNKDKYIGKPFSLLMKNMTQLQPTSVKSLFNDDIKNSMTSTSFGFSQKDITAEKQTILIVKWRADDFPTTPIEFSEEENKYRFSVGEKALLDKKTVKDITVIIK